VAPEHESSYAKLWAAAGSMAQNSAIKFKKTPRVWRKLLFWRKFIGRDNVCMILGDNIFEDDFSDVIKKFKSGAQVLPKR